MLSLYILNNNKSLKFHSRFGGRFFKKDLIRFVTEDLISLSSDNRYPMQTYMISYATSINKIQSLSGWDIQQTQIYLMNMAQKLNLMWLLTIMTTSQWA